MKSLGIDPSIKSTGLVLLKCFDKRVELLSAKTVKLPALQGREKLLCVVERIMQTVNFTQPDVICVEGYGLHFGHKSSVVPLVELGGILRYRLNLSGYGYLEPRPNQLKMAAGNGHAKKPEIKKLVYEKWGFDTDDDNLSDAYVCAVIGLAYRGKIHHDNSVHHVSGMLSENNFVKKPCN